MTLCMILLLLIKFMERLIKIKNSDYRMLVVSILFLALTVSFTVSFTVLFTFGHPLG